MRGAGGWVGGWGLGQGGSKGGFAMRREKGDERRGDTRKRGERRDRKESESHSATSS